MILVTGATGAFGKKTIQTLLEHEIDPAEISALVRTKEKATDLQRKGIDTRVGDYTDYESLVHAFRGIDKLLFISGSEVENRAMQHENVVRAAKKSGVGHIIYTSFVRNRELVDSAIAFLQETHLKTEKWLKESGMTFTILQNALYMDMIPIFVGETVIENGMIVLPAKHGKSSAALRSELAEAAAKVLITEGHDNKTYALTNSESVSYFDIARLISEASGKAVAYTSPSPAKFREELADKNVPEEYVELFTAFSVAQAQGELDVIDPLLEQILGRKPTSIKTYIKEIYG